MNRAIYFEKNWVVGKDTSSVSSANSESRWRHWIAKVLRLT